MEIVGIVLGVIAIGLIFWNKKNQDFNDIFMGGEIGNLQKGYKALMDDFNNYQITNERKIADLSKELEMVRNKAHQWDKAAHNRMDKMNKSLPSIIGQVVGQIEFSQDIINRQV